MKILIMLHYDFSDIRRGSIASQLPIAEIEEYAKNNDYWIVELYSMFPVTSNDSIKDIESLKFIDMTDNSILESTMFENCDIILTGGYKSLCLKGYFDDLLVGNNRVKINPDWVVSDPYYMNYDLHSNWEYPEDVVICPRKTA